MGKAVREKNSVLREGKSFYMRIFAIDAGTTQSGYCIMTDSYELLEHGKLANDILMQRLYDSEFETLVVEMIASYGMSVGKSVFETCVWIGRFIEAAIHSKGANVDKVYRKDEKINLCGTMKAKDSNVRQALIDRFARFDFKTGKGRKNERDFFYGVSKDAWMAIACAVCSIDRANKIGAWSE